MVEEQSHIGPKVPVPVKVHYERQRVDEEVFLKIRFCCHWRMNGRKVEVDTEGPRLGLLCSNPGESEGTLNWTRVGEV